MSKYLLNKFLYTVDRDPELVERYREDPKGTVEWWEAERANVILNVPGAERSTWLRFDDVERQALAAHDYQKLFELGGPRQFGPHGPDPEFDRKAVDWIASGDIEKALGEVSLDSLWEPGNATHGFLDFMLMMGVAGAGEKADYVDSLDLFHTMEAYFTWYPKGGGQA